MAKRHPGLPGPQIVQAVLKDVNALREQVRLPPVCSILRGRHHDNSGCPVGRTLCHGSLLAPVIILVAVTPRMLRYGDVTAKPSRQTASFIRDFDAGKYPGLVLP